ncbi:MAG TPA: aldehyde dehydrogenase family protein, partial [Myxococcota bacterium]|nr:aldehyde dehydrogenase family protein [Myxococcota bacterium]
MTRIGVQKTLKMYVGGQFIRSESGHTLPVTGARGETMHACKASRKDLRDTVQIAREAQPKWEARTAYNRGQIVYRLAEMLEDRARSFPVRARDVAAAADRAVHHAGWTDKIGAVLSTLNPVSTAYVNYSMVRPMGVIVVAPRAADGLLGLVEAACAPIVMGNAAILLVPAELAELAAAFAEALATSDLPGGVVNLLTGDVPAVLDWADKHDDVDALYLVDGALTAERLTASQVAAARTLRRVIVAPPAAAP